MRALLGSQTTSSASSTPSADRRPFQSSPQQTAVSLPTSAHEGRRLTSARQGGPTDPIERGLVTTEVASELLEIYKARQMPQWPLVVVPDHCTVDDLRCTKPLLLLAILAVASGCSRPELFSPLSTEVMYEYAHRIMISGEKSMELIQALLTTAIWYYPADRWGRLKFYEYVHLASTMAMSIGLGAPPTQIRDISTLTSTSFYGGEVMSGDPPSTDSSEEPLIERQRMLLSCYVACTA